MYCSRNDALVSFARYYSTVDEVKTLFLDLDGPERPSI